MYEIKKNIPRSNNSRGAVKYPKLHALARQMEIDDCVEVADEYEARALVTYIGYLRDDSNPLGSRLCKGSYRKNEDKFRVWRIR